MTSHLRRLLAPLLLLLATAPLARAEGAADNGIRTLDTGRLVVFQRGVAVGIEDFQYDRAGDSLMVSATHTRNAQVSDGADAKWVKKFGMVVNAADFALRSYTSNLEYAGHVRVIGIVPGDTAMTIYSEVDGNGDAQRVAQPPGKLFVMDPMLFTLFDVLCRNLSAQGLSRRPVQLVTLGNEPGCSEATATAAGSDTIRWGGRKLVARKWSVEDPSGKFMLWASPKGNLLKLAHEASGLEVVREEPRTAKPASPKR